MSSVAQNEIVLIADSKIIQIPILESQEELINLKDQQKIAYGPSPEILQNQDYTKLRKTVYEKLKEAQTLLPDGLRFCLYEGYRSLTLQKLLFDHRFEKLKTQHTMWSWDRIFDETMKMVSPVINKDGSVNVPPHSTGAAIDIYLMQENGDAVEMGIHPQDWKNDSDGSLSLTNSTYISDEARYYRQIMAQVLGTVGFVNYPTEYWHWSYGDRYWAYHRRSSHAIYGSVIDSVSYLE